MHEARALITAAMEDRPSTSMPRWKSLTDMVDSAVPRPSTAKHRRCRRRPRHPGHPPARRRQSGADRLRRRDAPASGPAETDRTSAIAEGISRDKDLTKSLLKSRGVPIPEGRAVDSPEDAWEAAQDIGLPVVVKPVDSNHGRGVFIDLKTREEVGDGLRRGGRRRQRRSRRTLDSRHRTPPAGHRRQAGGGQPRRHGDGDRRRPSNIRELLDLQVNCDPRRGPTEKHPLSIIRIDSAATIELGRQGWRPNRCRPAGARCWSSATPTMPSMSPTRCIRNRRGRLAPRASSGSISPASIWPSDISQPLEQGGAIVEVNAGPSLLMHLKPGVGKPRPGRAGDCRPPVPENARPYPGRRHHRQQGARPGRQPARPPAAADRQACRRCLQRRPLLGRRQVEKDAANWTAAAAC